MKCSGVTRSGRNCRKNAVLGGTHCRDHVDQSPNERGDEDRFDLPEITHPKKKAFLLAYINCGTIKSAAKAAGIERTTHYYWLADPEYQQAFNTASLMAGQSLQDEAVRRAFKGSDRLLMFLLKGAMPDKYKERRQIQSESKVTVTKAQIEEHEVLNVEELKQLRRLKAKIDQGGGGALA